LAVLARLMLVLFALLVGLPAAAQEPGPRAQVMQRFGGELRDAALQGYVAQVGARIASAAGRPVRFTLLDSDVVNAFTTGDDEVFVTRGLLAIVASEAELASVLGHEVGHIVADHAAQRSEALAEAKASATVAAVLTGDPDSGRAVAGFGQAQLASFSQAQELEADRIGVELLRRAGYAPLAMAQFLETLGDQGALAARMEERADAERFNILSTHPVNVLRVRNAERAAGADLGGETGREAYLHAIDGMLYGDAPGQGFARGRSFVHPDLDFRFDVPPGFVLRNAPSQVNATRGDGARIVFDAAHARGVASPVEYLTRRWLPRADLADLRSFDLNGRPAVSARASAWVDGEPAEIRIVAVRWRDDTMFRFIFGYPARISDALDAQYRQVIFSLTRAGDAARRLRPHRLRIATVTPGETVKKIASRLPFADFREDRLRVLNGYPPDYEPPAGARIKIVE
jgi:predicted Zn-dependent protease